MPELHSKAKGTLGEISVAKDLLHQGYQVFVELGDNSRVDLVVMDEQYYPFKVQVKALRSQQGSVVLHVTKSGPGYRFRYEARHVDVFAIYVLDRDMIAYVGAEDLLSKSKSLTLRIDPALNGQENGINWFTSFSEFRKALRGHTRRTLTDSAEGEEMVQTATGPAVPAGES